MGQRTDPVGQDSITEALAYASEHPDGISSERFVDFIFNDAATRFGNVGLRELAGQTGMLGWGGGLPIGPICATLRAAESGARTGFEATT
jgi:hypothetical protein